MAEAAPATAPPTPPLLRMDGIVKSFGGVRALRGASLEVRAGEVHALLGENGAGKSTMMNVLSGVLRPDEGTIQLGGEPQDFTAPAAAQAAGVAMIHQELDLVPQQSVAANLFLGREPRTRVGTVDTRAMRRAAGDALDEVGVELPLGRPLASLRVGEQQMVAIAKALTLDARVLVMDEPTSALADHEVERLFALVPALRRRGVGVVYISHRMAEISQIADRGTVMRDGETVGTFDVGSTSPNEVIRMMVGQPIEQLFPDRTPVRDEVRLEVRGLAVAARDESSARSEPKGVDLTVRAGEVVGLAGLLGSGRSELLGALFGTAGRRLAGEVLLDGDPVRLGSSRAALAAGIGYVPEDRRASGLAMLESVHANVTMASLGSLSRLGLRRRRHEASTVLQSLRELQVKTASPEARVGTLSGGNQQKVLFARQMLTRPRLLLLDEPTRGVDIGAKSEIYRLLADLAGEGMAVLVASSELPELLGICDRVVVLRDGRVAADLATSDPATTAESVLATASLDVAPDHGDHPAPEQEAS